MNTSHSPSIYQQQQDYSPQSQANRYPANKLSSVISNPNLISNRSNSTPSPSAINQSAVRTTSQPNIKLPETYYHVNVAQLKSKFDANAQDAKVNTNSNLNVKTLDKKNLESSFQLEKENRSVLKQLQAKKETSAKEESSAHESYHKLSGEPELNRSSDYQINNFQTEQLEVLQKETERIEFEKNAIANNINETDLKIAKCRQKIQVLMDEIKGKRHLILLKRRELSTNRSFFAHKQTFPRRKKMRSSKSKRRSQCAK